MTIFRCFHFIVELFKSRIVQAKQSQQIHILKSSVAQKNASAFVNENLYSSGFHFAIICLQS